MKNKTANFFFEAGALKRVKRSGWWLAGVKEPESVAEHSFRAALIAWALGRQANCNAEKAVMMLLVHDLPEARLTDLHKVAQRLLDHGKAEGKAVEAQAKEWGEIGGEYGKLMHEFVQGKTREAVIAKDADLLECAFQAKEYKEIGYTEADDWLQRIGGKLKTKEAKKVFSELKKTKSSAWWKNLKKE
ncbi:MAG: HD domain-containing protein [Candidatus Diapherotrites archaeon]